MRIGFMAAHDRERIEFMKRHGFSCVELMVKPDTPYLPDNDGWKAKADAVKNDFQQADIRISCIAGFYVNHMDNDRSVAEGHAGQVRRVIQLAEYLGVPVVGGFAGRILGEPLEASLPRFKEIWSEHARFAEDHGIKIAFEHCPMGQFHTPFGGNNCICTPDMWDRCFDAVPSPVLGLEWDPSHLICQLIDPIGNIRRYADKIFHVHAKDARIYPDLLARYGLFHTGVAEHCFAGLGDTAWPIVIKELIRSGYPGDLNIEGWHDPVYRDHEAGLPLEDQGLLLSLNHLSPFVDGR